MLTTPLVNVCQYLVATLVALPADSIDESIVLAFLNEASFMLKFRHPNIIWVEGVCLDVAKNPELPGECKDVVDLHGDPVDGFDMWTQAELARSPLILLPFMDNGDLHTLLKEARRMKPDPEWLVR